VLDLQIFDGNDDSTPPPLSSSTTTSPPTTVTKLRRSIGKVQKKMEHLGEEQAKLNAQLVRIFQGSLVQTARRST
jgi:hypothetical protein